MYMNYNYLRVLQNFSTKFWYVSRITNKGVFILADGFENKSAACTWMVEYEIEEKKVLYER